jgi:hypothetical protein
MSKNQSQSFETRQKPATLEYSQVEMREHLHEFHCEFTSHLTWVKLNMGHRGPLD